MQTPNKISLDMTEIIGRGEKTAKKILRFAFPTDTILQQQPIQLYVESAVFDLYDEVYQKASVDLALFHKGKLIAIRVQDKHHTGPIASRKDRVQRHDMESNGVVVIDIFERESPYLFREILNYKSIMEVLRPLESAGIKP